MDFNPTHVTDVQLPLGGTFVIAAHYFIEFKKDCLAVVSD
jgi:hypothetical protein